MAIRDPIDRQLRRERPVPSREFVDRLARSIGGHRGRGYVLRLTAIVGVSLATAAAVAAVGGVGHAASVSKQIAKAVDTQNASNSRVLVQNSPAQDQYQQKCNSGRGNLSETENGNRQNDSSTLINPHTGGTGPGTSPTDDCDPGNSGDHNRGGD